MMQEKKKITFEQEKDILNIIYKQINSFDNKAAILVSIVGIVFGLSLSFLDVFPEIKNLDISSREMLIKYVIFGVIYFLFCLSAAFVFTFSTLVIFPRKNRGKKNNINYYGDLKDMSYSEFENIGIDLNSNDEIIFNQIKTNSKICSKKHFFLQVSICSLIPFFVLMLILILLSIIFLI